MKITVSKESFIEMLQGLVASGCQFKAIELGNNLIEVKFTGGF